MWKLTISTLWLAWAWPAHAISCDEVAKLSELGVSTEQIVAVLGVHNQTFSPQAIACLQAKKLPQEVVDAASGKPAPATEQVLTMGFHFKTLGGGDDVRTAVAIRLNGWTEGLFDLGTVDGDMCYWNPGEGSTLVTGLCRDRDGFGARYKVVVRSRDIIIERQEFGDHALAWERLKVLPRPPGVTIKAAAQD